MTYKIRFLGPAIRAVERDLPEKIAAAVCEFIYGALAENPHRVGKQLHEPFFPLYSARRGEYRVLYRILDTEVVVEVAEIAHRRDSYR